MKHPHREEPPTHQLKEVFCSELPSPFCQNQIRIAGKIDETCIDRPPSIQLATELHSLSLSKRSVCTNREDASRSRRVRGGDEYFVSVKPLASSKTSECKEQSKLRKEMRKIVNATSDDYENCVCVSHSALTFDSTEDTLSTLEVFALSRSAPDPDQVATTHTSRPTHVKSTSETSCGISLSSSVKDGEVGANIHEDVPAQAPTYYLLAKTTFVESIGDNHEEGKQHTAKLTRHKLITDTIPLDVQPSLVHVTELQLSSNNNNSGDEVGIPAVGIFISDDNKLRLYVAKRNSLHQRRLQGQHPIKSSCFTLSSLFFDATNDALENGDESPQDPFVFSSSITALDTFLTHDILGVNKLAIGLFDGTIQIMTYRLSYKSGDGAGLKSDNSNNLEELNCTFLRSTFIVDGPVTTIHFGRLDLTDICSQFNQEPISNLFVVAGSLCGFACLFYEMPTPESEVTSSATQSTDLFPYFTGPIPIVDELYDATHDNEDCVLSVQACCSNNSKPMIAVGTHRGRVLLYQRTTDPSYAFDESSFFKDVTSKRNELIINMTTIAERIKDIQTEKNEMQLESERLELSMAVHREMESLLSSSPATESMPDGSLAEDVGPLSSESYDENVSPAPPEHEQPRTADEDERADDKVDEGDDGSEDFIGDIDIEATMTPDVTCPIPPEGTVDTASECPNTQANKEASLLQSKIRLAETELAKIQQKISSHDTEVAELTLSLETQQRDFDTLKNETRCTLHSSLRKIHRYELVCQCQLPYPILGIQYHFGVLLIFTRRSLHMFCKALSNNASIGERLDLFEKKMAEILAIHAP